MGRQGFETLQNPVSLQKAGNAVERGRVASLERSNLQVTSDDWTVGACSPLFYFAQPPFDSFP